MPKSSPAKSDTAGNSTLHESAQRGQEASTDGKPTTSRSSRKRKSSSNSERDQKYVRIEAANRLNDADFQSTYLPPESPLRSFSSKNADMKYHMSMHSVASIPTTALKACFSLVEETSREAYKASQNGWKPRAKWREMREPDMKYVLVYRKDDNQSSVEQMDPDANQPDHAFCGFLSFQLSVEAPVEVLYIYEIHLVESARGIGLGHHLMQLVEEIARHVGVAKTMLTVYTSNIPARSFYEGLGYCVDDISPRDRKLRGVVRLASYAILSKIV